MANHVFTDTHMAMGHRGLAEELKAKGYSLAKGDAAIFVNKAWTAAKILARHDVLIHVRGDATFTVDDLVRCPTVVGGKPLSLTREQRAYLDKAYRRAVKRAEVKNAA